MNPVDAIRTAIVRHELIPDGSRVVAGVSGGADSVALVYALHELKIPCTIAHLNHGLRETESNADEQFVSELAKRLELPFVSKKVEVTRLAQSTGLSIEMAARQARHNFFEEFENSVIALAHHADDQVETFLLKLARGAGTQGLGGMRPMQAIGSLHLIRPMLDISQADILHWLREQGYEWREDSSNADETFLRNRVRHTILPMLKKELNPTIDAAILRTMDILQHEDAWMNGLLEDTDVSDEHPLAAQRRVLRKWLIVQGATDPTFDAVEQILEHMKNKAGTTYFELNGSQRVAIEYGIPRFEQLSVQKETPQFMLTINKGTGWQNDESHAIGRLPANASFSADKIAGATIAVRCYEPGDRIEPFGMEGSRKLQDIFTDHKIPKEQRGAIAVVLCRGEIIWLPGYRIARGWEVKNRAADAVHVCIEQKRTD